MTRLTTERLDELEIVSRCEGLHTVTHQLLCNLIGELKDRRNADRELTRLADVCKQFHLRNGFWPDDAVRATIDKLLNGGR